MISNGTIVIPLNVSSLNSWSIEPTWLNSLYIAVLTTILTYQLTAIVTDLLLGFKPRLQASAAVLQSHLISLEPISSICIVSSNERLLKWRYRHVFSGDLPGNTVKASFWRMLFAVTLSSSTYVFSLIAILLTVERRQTVLLSDTSFSGVSFGFVKEPVKVQGVPVFGGCIQMPLETPQGYDPMVQFHYCFQDQTWEYYSGSMPRSGIAEIEIGNDSTIKVSAVGQNRFNPNVIEKVSSTIFGIVETESKLYRVMHGSSIDEMEELLLLAVSSLNTVRKTANVVSRTEEKGNLRVSVNVSFFEDPSNFTRPWIIHAPQFVGSKLRFVESERLYLADENGENFKDQSDLPVLHGRTRILSEGLLAIVTSVMMLLRIATRMFTNNDVESFLLSILKTFSELNASTSPIWEKKTFDYVQFCETPEASSLNEY